MDERHTLRFHSPNNYTSQLNRIVSPLVIHSVSQSAADLMCMVRFVILLQNARPLVIIGGVLQCKSTGWVYEVGLLFGHMYFESGWVEEKMGRLMKSFFRFWGDSPENLMRIFCGRIRDVKMYNPVLKSCFYVVNSRRIGSMWCKFIGFDFIFCIRI